MKVSVRKLNGLAPQTAGSRRGSSEARNRLPPRGPGDKATSALASADVAMRIPASVSGPCEPRTQEQLPESLRSGSHPAAAKRSPHPAEMQFLPGRATRPLPRMPSPRLPRAVWLRDTARCQAETRRPQQPGADTTGSIRFLRSGALGDSVDPFDHCFKAHAPETIHLFDRHQILNSRLRNAITRTRQEQEGHSNMFCNSECWIRGTPDT